MASPPEGDLFCKDSGETANERPPIFVGASVCRRTLQRLAAHMPSVAQSGMSRAFSSGQSEPQVVGKALGVEEPTEDAARPPGLPPEEPIAMRLSAHLLERLQDIVSILAGVLLVTLAAIVLGSAVVDFARSVGSEPLITGATRFLDRVLLVLILVEIVHTVVLSVRAHTLVPEPFLIVGLVAVIRRILLIVGEELPIEPLQFGLLIAMVAVFVASLVVVRLLARNGEQ